MYVLVLTRANSYVFRYDVPTLISESDFNAKIGDWKTASRYDLPHCWFDLHRAKLICISADM